MQTVTFECEIITPMFMAGADGGTPELRPPAMKGALRFWWRALNGHLSLRDLKTKEDKIFGGGGENATRSKVLINCSHPQLVAQTQPMYSRPGKEIAAKGYNPRQTFTVTLKLTEEIVDGFGIKHLLALFEIICLLGGFGKRSRRGRGAIKIKAMKEGDKEFTPVTADVTLETILEKLKLFSPHFKVNNGEILYDYMGRSEGYPTIQRIQIGGYDPKILAKIDSTTHQLLSKHEERYAATMGHASRGRFASPMYTSVIVDQNGGLRPIITSLNTIPDAARKNMTLGSIQDEYKKNII